ncbi:putative patatin-like serine [Phaeomoniella chlamydospora]|uniref:Lysophospholipase NTE1 n=1 Tax=Phaeomoniella chlamydospora TaxID=158046 RepID=A0A0G2H717_PHACM|nr:putative patatin-like serine [Phaeomoniella chlamydospora]
MYARLPPEPQRKEPNIDLFPDTRDDDTKPGLANYLDEFLSAIKVFGYLERPVFHELTRTMQTRKLIAGETLMLEEEKGFCLVVDGLVQIFVKSTRESFDRKRGDTPDHRSNYGGEEDPDTEGNQGYQLLTEVKNGASMSSLFSILSLFSEDVKLRADDDSTSAGSSFAMSNRQTPTSAGETPFEMPHTPHRQSLQGRRADHQEANRDLPTVPPLSLGPLDHPLGNEAAPKSHHRKQQQRYKSAHPDLLARAVVDSTIAVIPASAFRRLTRVYPRATAHIVQVILTRLQRVTLSTANKYLGLTTEVLQMEKHMNKYTSVDLPNHLRGAALDRLKAKFQKEWERIGAEEGMKGIALHNPNAGSRRRSTSTLRKEAALAARLNRPSDLPTIVASPEHEITNPNPGDLLSNVQSSRYGNLSNGFSSLRGVPWRYSQDFSNSPSREQKTPLTQREAPPFQSSTVSNSLLLRQESFDEDSIFREAVLNAMTKALGLTGGAREIVRKDPTSVPQSPRLVSYDSRRQTAVFNNAFGFMDPFDPSVDGDSDSVVSGMHSTTGSMSGMQNGEELIDDLEIVFFPKGSVLVEQGERNPGIYYVIDGFLDVGLPVEGGEEKEDIFNLQGPRRNGSIDDPFAPLRRSETGRSTSIRAPSLSGDRKAAQSRKSVFLVKPGGLAGYIGTISSYRSFTDVTAKTDVHVGFLPRSSIERIVDKYPKMLLTMAKRMTSLLPHLITHIDFALEWVQVNAGQVIHHQGDDSDSIYIVLNGRLRAVMERGDGSLTVTGEFGQGESIGELEVMTESTRPATLHAIRDTELAKFPRTLFNSLAQEHPNITIQISKLIAQRMRILIENPLSERGQEHMGRVHSHGLNSTMNLRTVAILPVATGVPVVEFAHRLLNALTQVGVTNGVTSLNQAAILNHLGRHAFNRMGKLKLSQYLADLEEKFGMVLYVADTNVNAPWTQTCISQADCILLVGLAEGSPSIGEYERFLLGMKTTARKDLVLLHAERYVRSGLTRKWLRNRVWINGRHHHVQMAFRTAPDATPNPQGRRLGKAIKQRVQVLQAEIQKYTSRRVPQRPLFSADTPFKGDFHRLARRLCGKSVGLVLGGGGARGISQVGVIRALEEAGIPIDMIGGTSIGAFVGALYAWDADVVPMYGRAKKFAGRMGSMWRFALDLTYPTLSYTTGHEFNRGIFKTFGNSQIEDFWLEYYCNTTNISKSRAEIHNSGYIWRYVRASMTLAGLVPPLCDEGSMLVDGGYMDNLTVAHMKSLGADVVFAVDVGAIDDDRPQAFGDSLSGFWATLNRWNPFSSFPNPPTLSEIQGRLAYVSSVDALERAKTTPGCLYMRPPIDAYATLDFAKFDEIYQVGYEFGKKFLDELKERGELKGLAAGQLWGMDASEAAKGLRRTMAPRRASI